MKYDLRYVPSFYEDLHEIVYYISKKLNNPQAAVNLVNNVEEAILKRLEMPTAFEVYSSSARREHDYYRIYVGNYTVFYVVIDNVMEVRRIIYSSRDFKKFL